jgi:hypothetical protein
MILVVGSGGGCDSDGRFWWCRWFWWSILVVAMILMVGSGGGCDSDGRFCWRR